MIKLINALLVAVLFTSCVTTAVMEDDLYSTKHKSDSTAKTKKVRRWYVGSDPYYYYSPYPPYYGYYGYGYYGGYGYPYPYYGPTVIIVPKQGPVTPSPRPTPPRPMGPSYSPPNRRGRN
jgi:hypothetical protein